MDDDVLVFDGQGCVGEDEVITIPESFNSWCGALVAKMHSDSSHACERAMTRK